MWALWLKIAIFAGLMGLTYFVINLGSRFEFTLHTISFKHKINCQKRAKATIFGCEKYEN